jgi:acyl carrier protein
MDDARGSSIIPPRDPFECLIAELWQELLEISDVSISDTFIGIGGDSILALQFINRLREKTGTQLSVANVFLETLEKLAEDLRKTQPA